MMKKTAAAWIVFCPAEFQQPPMVSQTKSLYVHASSAGQPTVSAEFSGRFH
jgi:DNA-dependent RNA polymerase auxiliary subunit epsilon